MNRAYRTVYNEHTGTFVAVAENVKAKGKRSSSRVSKIKAGGIATIAAGSLFMGSAMADVVIDEADNTIEFNTPGGHINFQGGGSITGLTDLSVSGSLGANQLILGSTTFSAGDIATTTALNAANANITTAQNTANAAQTSANTANAAIGTLQTNLGNSIATNNLNVASGALVASSTGVIIGADLDMGGNKITNLADGDISATSTDAVTGQQIHNLFIEEGANGIRYFRANSTAPDSAALGDESIAIGPNTIAEGDSSFAAGDGASTTETAEGAIALGQSAEAGSTIDGDGAIAIGRNSVAGRNGSVALGDSAQSTGVDATAVGAGAGASASNATALGANAQASGSGSIAIGDSEATADSAFAAGTGAYAATAGSVALGVNAGVGTVGNAAGDRTNHIAIGTASGQNVAGNQTTAIGYGAGSNVEGDDNVALGTEAGRGLTGNNNISIGTNANDGAGTRAQAIAIGDGTRAGSDSVAMGSGATAEGSETLALGKDAHAGANGVAVGAHATAEGSNIALGRNSAAREADLVGSGYLTGSVAPGSAVSVGNSNPGEAFQRRITNVADGAQGYDAVNVRQLQGAQQSVANLVGGNVTVESNGSFGGYVIELTDTGGATHQYTTVAAAINAVSSGEISVLPGNAVIYNPNGTVTVAEGVVGTDAVNVAQLEQAIAENGVKYYSANTTVSANRDNDGATGDNAMAIGPAAVASGDASLAIGYAARVNAGAHNGVAIGHDVSARALDSTAIGNRTHVYDQAGVAIGREAVSRGQNSIVMGTGAEADPKSGQTVDNAIVIGTVAEATADDGIAIGQSALASEERAVAQGYDAHATAEDAQAFGTRSRASGVNSQASGTDARASGRNSIATGTDSRAYAADGIAIGTGATTGVASPPLGEERRNINGIAVGNSALADYENAMALGVEARARADSATAIGDSAEATALNALAVGTDARASEANATALGRGSQATHQRSVALGDGAATSAAVGTSSSTIDKVTYNYAGTNPVATVSVGTETEKRTITNVAAGRVSATSTDAINGSQLFRTNQAVDALGNNLDTAGDSVAAALGGGSSYNPNTHQVTANLTVNGNTYNNVQDALGYVGQGWDVSANGDSGANVAPGGSVDFNNTDNNIDIERNGTDLTFNLADDLVIDNSISINGGPRIHVDGIDMGGNRITNLSPGEDGTDAVNLNQLNEVGATASRGWDLSVNGGAAETVAPGDEVNFSNTDGNILISQDGTDLKFDLNPDIDLTADGSLTIGNTLVNNDGLAVDDGAGNSTTTTAAGTTVTNAAGDTTTVGAGSISVADADGNETTIGGTQVVVGGGNPVTIDGSAGTISGLQNQTVDYPEFADGSGRAATEEQLGIVQGEISDLADTPLTFAGDTGTNVDRKLGETVNLTGGATDETALTDGNIGVVADGTDTLEIKLNKDIDLTADGSVAIADAGGNGSTLDADGLAVVDGDNETLVGAGSISVTDPDGTTIIGGNQISIGGNNPIVISGDTGIISGLQNQTVHYPGFADGSGRAATEEQLKPITDFIGLDEDGNFIYNGNTYATLEDALNSMHWNVEAPGNGGGGSGGSDSGSGGSGGSGGDTGTGGGSGGDSTPIHNGNTVGFTGDDNIIVSKTERSNGEGADINIALAKDITVDSITAIDVKADRIEISNGGPVIDQNGINMNDKRITNVAPGVDATDAVNVGQLQQATGNLQNQVNNLRNDLRRQDKKLSGGVAAAMATASLPQAYLPGKNMMAIAGGTWNGETGMAIGFSGISDNGHWVYKLTGNATSRGDYGGGVGIGYQW